MEAPVSSTHALTAARARAVAFLIGATLFWAGNYVVGASAVRDMTPLSLVYLRWIIAVGPLLLVAQLVERPAWGEVLRRWALLSLLSALGLGAYTLLLYEALRHTSPLNAALINSFNPAVILLAAAIFLREQVGWRGVLGVGLGLLGVILVLTKGCPLSLFGIRYNSGDLLMLIAIACWTAYTILARRLRGIPPIASTAVQALILVLAMTPIALVVGMRPPTTASASGSLLFIGVFPSFVSYLLWNSALTMIDAGKAGIFLNLITVFTAVASIALGHPITLAQVLGGILVLGGVYIATLKRKAK